MKATAYRGRWRRTLLAQGSDRGFGALQLERCCLCGVPTTVELFAGYLAVPAML